jgi:protein-tyrosine phosphatase
VSRRVKVLWRRLWLGGGARLLSIALVIAARIGPLRRRLHEGALRSVADADVVLFVCHGNINRSALAAALARQGWPDVEVLEAGHDAIDGAATDEHGLAAAIGSGVDLSAHRAARLDADALRRADIVFAFDARNYLALAARGALVGHKLRLLAALAPDGPLEIADPHGGPASAYEAAFAAIGRAIAAR